MKSFIITLLSLFVVCVALPPTAAAHQWATQGARAGGTTPYNEGSITAEIQRKKLGLTGNHELRLSIAYNPYTPHGYAPNQVNWNSYPKFTPRNSIVGSTRWFTLNGEYGYYLKRWLHIGVAASWTGGFRPIWSSIDHSRIGGYDYNSIALLPKARFSYLNREVIQLYSGVGIGGAFAIYDDAHSNAIDHKFDVSFDVTLFGITIGKRWFGYIELGAGTQGTLRAGFGYRFNNRNR